MMKRKLLVATFSFAFFSALAGEGEYAISKIPPALLKNANVVKRSEEERFELKNPAEAYYTYKYVLTILNENGDKYAGFYVPYDKYSEIRNIEGMLYDASGKEIKKLKNKDIHDQSAVDDGSLMEDNRIKFHNFYCKVYPYTIEYMVEIKFNETMFYPTWFPRENEFISVQESSFVFVCADNYDFRYKASHYEGEPIVQHEKEKKIYTWTVKDLPAIKDQPFSPYFNELTTCILFGPTEFEIQGYKGNMKSWQDFGKFTYALKVGRDELPPEVKQSVHQLIDGVTDPNEKIRNLYEYLQKNTRYISVQLGIGGWQPYDAKYVATKGYGDCKALSNYMYSLLKEAGIRSIYTLIIAGRHEKEIETDFPSAQFTHVILCVPLAKDTVWLECTSQTLPAGYLSGFTADRYALLIDENGGTLVRTPKYGIKENLQIRRIKAMVDEDGTLQTKVYSRYCGMQQDELHGMIHALSKDKVKEYLHEELDFATYEVNQFDYKENKSSLPEIDESLDITVSNYASITGKRFFVTPDIMTRSSLRLKLDEERKYDLDFRFEYNDIDSVEIDIPSGYELEAIPQDITVTSKFGKYSSFVKLKDNRIYYYRNMEHYSGRFPATDYPELVKFYDAAYKADRAKVVLVKKG